MHKDYNVCVSSKHVFVQNVYNTTEIPTLSVGNADSKWKCRELEGSDDGNAWLWPRSHFALSIDRPRNSYALCRLI